MPGGLRQSRINPKENGVKMACNGCTPHSLCIVNN
jgi:hypothetical protein